MIIFRKVNIKRIIKKRKDTDGNGQRDVRDVEDAGCGGMGI
jgi:hypothetical protein